MFQDIYRKIEEKKIDECRATGTLYEHVRTGARVFTLKNDDPNRVFMIGFRTIPSDSTGVAHIMEHSVLCGSEKYPLKDPFVELAKGSLNTFLNAMTYPDKTVYPVASCNEKDFCNLINVYLDAVFHPNIYREKNIFLQEGWHYEIGEDGKLTVNGVVYNEMKGVFSSPDSVLERYTMNALFPHTTYGYESGGDPDCIPSLTYEEFLEFHKKFYHPSNSFLYLYGDLDMEEKLLWIDREYLSTYERKEIDSRVTAEPAFSSPGYVEKEYAVTKDGETESKTYLSENYVVPEVKDSLTDLAWEVLDFVLLAAPGAPLKEELIKLGFGDEIYGGYNAGILQPYFSVIARNTDRDKLPAFREAVERILTRLVTEGIDKKSLYAALNYLEFKYREEDYGRTPAGLEYGLTSLESWLYDREPWLFLTYREEFRKLKELAETDFYEKLLKAAVIGNPHSAEVVVCPKAGLTEEKETVFAGKLDALKSSLSETELDAIRKENERLTAWQEEAETEEEKKCLPMLTLKDIGIEAEKVIVGVKDNVIFSPLPTNGIAYLRLNFDLSRFSERKLQLAAFLKILLGELNTAKHTYKELTDEILLNTGGVDFSLGTVLLSLKPGIDQPFAPVFGIEIRALKEGIEKGLSLAFEILEETLFDDTERIVEKLKETRSQAQSAFEVASHMIAMTRCQAYTESVAGFNDLTGGIDWYDFLQDTLKKVKKKEGLSDFVKELEEVAAEVKTASFETALGGDEELLLEVNRALDRLGKKNRVDIQKYRHETCRTVKPLGNLKEGFRTSSMVNYVARSGRYLSAEESYSGSMEVLKVLLNYEYLWLNLRVKGGAYGCMCNFSMSGKAFFVSYRDPGVGETDRVYEELPDWLADAEISDENVLRYIIGAIAGLDQPVTVSVKAGRQLNYYYTGLTDEILQEKRDALLKTDAGTLRGFAGNLRKMLSEGNICVVGNGEKILSDGKLFNTTREIR